jgi:Flp pilus assembly protein CpaB
MTYRLRNIIVAVALALVAALLTSFYVSNYQRDVRRDEANVTVFVAAGDIPVGTSGAEAVSKGMLEKSEVVRRSVVPGAISTPDQLDELVAVQPTFAGEQVTARRFATPAARGIRAQLTGTQRAVSLAGDQQQLLVGTLKEGDKVDVVASFTHNDIRYTRLVLRDVPVLKPPAGGAATEKLAQNSEGDYAATVLVTDLQVQKLHWAMTFADAWHFELRPVVDGADSAENVESSLSMLREGVRPKQLEDAGVEANR